MTQDTLPPPVPDSSSETPCSCVNLCCAASAWQRPTQAGVPTLSCLPPQAAPLTLQGLQDVGPGLCQAPRLL